MSMNRKIRSALVSVYHKEELEAIVRKLASLDIRIFSTGGTYDFVTGLGIAAVAVETLTGYPSILGGRVKTLHPAVFGGILFRRDDDDDKQQSSQYKIPPIDLVIVDLYPFEDTVAQTDDEAEIIEKIDIGGISLIRAAAKNYRDVLIISSSSQYPEFLELLGEKEGITSLEERRNFAGQAFDVTSHYDTAIYKYFSGSESGAFKESIRGIYPLRYGENPHQKGLFYGDPDKVFRQLHGKEISYNNLGDLEAGIGLISEFNETTFAILKHNNACGCASRPVLREAWTDALAGDPVSAFGGVLVTNAMVDEETAQEIDRLFFEIILAPGYKKSALETLQSKKNRILLQLLTTGFPVRQFRSMLNGVIVQEKDLKTERAEDLRPVTDRKPTDRETEDLLFANRIVKHTRSNAIVLAKNKQLLASGAGQTSRVDALKQAIAKAGENHFDLTGAVLASDAFFPFADSVEIAHRAGISAIIQPGGSIRDQDSIDYCRKHGLAMVFTGIRHFKH
ncbi:MAG: bifunctional phosphoribosylaminoimidazolecarboxamide formyltransferase/IMP cyclohydrolase [Bacteroidales bacterium]|nr:bifunctional phosphoribosylaminoimidazolecarboxamide formyltransferase/IMP cyclohydrolase [Bacteroidales bacterium]